MSTKIPLSLLQFLKSNKLNKSIKGNLIKFKNGIFIYQDGVNTGIVKHKNRAILINCGGRDLLKILKQLKITTIDKIIFTHHRRELADSLDNVLSNFNPEILIPKKEKDLFISPGKYWSNKNARWMLFVFEHINYHTTHINKINSTIFLKDDEEFFWNNFNIRIKETPGYTDGSISIIIKIKNKKYIFSGDIIYSQGKIYDLYPLQHENKENGHQVGDYHGYLGSRLNLISSLKKINSENSDFLLPSHGEIINNPKKSLLILISNIKKLYKNYIQISALRWYFPQYFSNYKENNPYFQKSKTIKFPNNVKIIDETTWLLISKNKNAVIIDPYRKEVLSKLKKLLDTGKIVKYDYIWITHYHHDHMSSAAYISKKLNCPIVTTKNIANIIENPKSHYLTCLSKNRTIIKNKINSGYAWKWDNYILSGYDFPGQTYYHSGLLAVSDDKKKLFFSGDSFTPYGIDDYCMWNRNFLGKNKGYDYCVNLLKELNPDIIFNQHVNVGFNFTSEQYDKMIRNLKNREKIIQDLVPWDNVNYALDEYWIHPVPYEQNIKDKTEVKINISNHSNIQKYIELDINNSKYFSFSPNKITGTIPANTEASFNFIIKKEVKCKKNRYIFPVNIIYDNKNLGSFREFIINVIR